MLLCRVNYPCVSSCQSSRLFCWSVSVFQCVSVFSCFSSLCCVCWVCWVFGVFSLSFRFRRKIKTRHNFFGRSWNQERIRRSFCLFYFSFKKKRKKKTKLCIVSIVCLFRNFVRFPLRVSTSTSSNSSVAMAANRSSASDRFLFFILTILAFYSGNFTLLKTLLFQNTFP